MSKFLSEGKKKLNNWFINDKKNILIFPTIITVFEWPLYKYAEQLGYKVIFDQVETSFFLNGKMSFLHWLYIGMSEKLSHFAYKKNAAFVISTALYDAVHSKYPNRKICLLPNSTPLHNDKAKKILHNPLLILYSGTYSPKDGVTYLIEGVIKAFEQGCQCRLILLGKGTPEDMKVLNKIKNKKYIEYRGFVSDEELINTMKNCDVLCMTRTNSVFANYGFPFKLSEYLATGNLVLATNVGDVSKYLEDKKNALIVAPENAHEIAQALLYVQNNPQKAILMANNSIDVAKRYFSIENVGKIFVNFLLEI